VQVCNLQFAIRKGDPMNFLEIPVKGVSRYLHEEHLHEKSLRFHISSVGPGERSHPPHQHGGFEAFYILEGEGTLEIGDERIVLNSGEGIVFDPRKLHGLVNTGSLPLQYMVIRAAQEDDPAG
jgi:mannose-6-phosphate isomerase-like protein (cupin superfamily)